MSLKMMTWAFTKDLKNSQFQVLVAIANEANDAGECFTGQLKLAYLVNAHYATASISSARWTCCTLSVVQ